MFTIVTSRFNNDTLEANYAYRKKHNLQCLYCCPSELSPKIHLNMHFWKRIKMNFGGMVRERSLAKGKVFKEVLDYFCSFNCSNSL
jgi:hypothetical protein